MDCTQCGSSDAEVIGIMAGDASVYGEMHLCRACGESTVDWSATPPKVEAVFDGYDAFGNGTIRVREVRGDGEKGQA